MENKKDLLTIGELAHMAGVTIRTLQYYDQKNLLKPVVTEGGRRKYTRDDVLRLEQILFLKSLGFSLDEIDTKILKYNNKADLVEVFRQQRKVLIGQIEHLNNMVDMLDAAIVETKNSQEINMDCIIAIIESMKRGNSYGFLVRYFNNEQLKSFATRLFDVSYGLNAKEVFDKLQELYEKGVDPEGKEGQYLAKLWWDMVNEFTYGDVDLLKAMINAGRDIQNWPDEVKDIKKPIGSFLAKALNSYIYNNSLEKSIRNLWMLSK
ncbi:MerR family transcriptional regulator [Clostridium oryzae]|uniref:HTH-type transcriptional activator TipA n=1 Tax=Clostridium oryzae TaxID=1450648 RepID=A0A1V4IZ94_9CLOT|nr:MerR family transcriptional regulator [Clostridium oryzae]OPJ65219.1 HTH-type transcriptional activator TipA [Clostridium oryzae]